MWRVVGVEMGLHDGEVEGVVVEDDAVLVLGVRGRARNAQAHVRQNDKATIVFRMCFSAGCCDMKNLSASLARP